MESQKVKMAIFLSPKNHAAKRGSLNVSRKLNEPLTKKADSSFGGVYSEASFLYGQELPSELADMTILKPLKTEFQPKYDMHFPKEYHDNSDAGHNDLVSEKTTNGVTEKAYKSGKIEQVYPRLKKVLYFPDGYQITYFSNGNIAQVYPNNEKYVDYSSKNKTTKIKFKSGLVTLKDKNTLIKFFPDGSQVIAHADGVLKVIDATNHLKVIHPDGRVKRVPYTVSKLSLQMYEKGIMPTLNNSN